jgi:predicted DNA binding CopG/RHH family protein
MEKPMRTPKIPQTDSTYEQARFWDTRDLTDFEDQLEEVTEPIFERTTETTITIHLALNEAEAVKRVTTSKGVEQASLLREWVVEKPHNT